MEPALRLHRSQACPSRWYPWSNDIDDPVWIIAIILDIGLEVNMPRRAIIDALNAVKPIPCRRTERQHRRYEEYVGGNSR